VTLNRNFTFFSALHHLLIKNTSGQTQECKRTSRIIAASSSGKVRKDHIGNEPYPEHIETPPKYGQVDGLYQAGDAGENEHDRDRLKDLSQFP
jgi:hypothetical protein